jgi:hypothetical protein
MSELIETDITGPVLRNGRIYFRASLASFFPADCLGARSGNGAHGLSVTIAACSEEYETDIRLSSGERISPRRSFARRLKSIRAGEGDRLRLVRVGERRFRLELVA